MLTASGRTALYAALAALCVAAACSDRVLNRDGDTGGGGLVLLLPIADGLRPGDLVLDDRDKKVGRVAGLAPKVNRVSAEIEWESKYRPAPTDQFLLERGEDGARRIRVIRGSGELSRAPGEPAIVRVTAEALNDNVWVVR